MLQLPTELTPTELTPIELLATELTPTELTPTELTPAELVVPPEHTAPLIVGFSAELLLFLLP